MGETHPEMHRTGLVLLIALQLVAPSAGGAIDVAHLDSGSFEHDTQAATGATTGDWFVMFYAPKCPKCEQIAESWGDLAVSLKERLTVAQVDCVESQDLCRRFGITDFPSLALFRKGKMYSAQDAWDTTAWNDFIQDGYKTAAVRDVPKPFSAVENLVWKLQQLGFKEKAGLGAVVCLL